MVNTLPKGHCIDNKYVQRTKGVSENTDVIYIQGFIFVPTSYAHSCVHVSCIFVHPVNFACIIVLS